MIVAALDLRSDQTADSRLFNIEAEQALLGALIYHNAARHDVGALRPDHFKEGLHGALFAEIVRAVDAGELADPILMDRRMKDHPGYVEARGVRYLADLLNHAPPPSAAPHYATEIIDLACRRSVLGLAEAAARELRNGADTAPTIEVLEDGLVQVRTRARQFSLLSASDAIRDMLDDLSAPAGSEGGVLTGIDVLDEHLGRLQPEELILIAGRPGMGKSALASCIALNIARSGLGVIEINSEMSTRQMMRRHVSDLAFKQFGSNAPTYKDLKRRAMTAPQRSHVEWAAREISDLPIAMIKKTGLTIAALRSLVRGQTAAWARAGITLGAVTVDHVGLLQAESGGRDRYSDQTQIAISMKALADELKVPVIAMVQLSRKVEDRDNKRPMLSDLRDTGAWEENADIAIGTFREAYYAAKELEPKADGRPGADEKWNEWSRRRSSKTVEAILMKVREGEEATIPLWASIGHNAIRSADPDDGGFL